MRTEVQHVAGVVVQPAHDLGIGAAGEPTVGEVRLPALVRLFGLEPRVGSFRPLRRVLGLLTRAGSGTAAHCPR
jgi:hypothetical protein